MEKNNAARYLGAYGIRTRDPHSLTSFSFPARQKSISGNNSSGDRAARDAVSGAVSGEIIAVNHCHWEVRKLNLF
jgi:hypothetical protein